MKLIVNKVLEGKASSKDLFKAIDNEGDKNGTISKLEFESLSKRIGMNFTIHRINEIFSSIKEKSKNKIGELNEDEFEMSMKYLSDKNTNMSL